MGLPLSIPVTDMPEGLWLMIVEAMNTERKNEAVEDVLHMDKKKLDDLVLNAIKARTPGQVQ